MPDERSIAAEVRNLFKGFEMSVAAPEFYCKLKTNTPKKKHLASPSSQAQSYTLPIIAIFSWISRPLKSLSVLVKLPMGKLPGGSRF